MNSAWWTLSWKTFLFLIITDHVLCEEDRCIETNTSPYAKLYKRRNGALIESVEHSGFLDLRNFTNVLLCTNGPALMYTETTTDTNGDTIFTSPRADKMFEKQCEPVNQIVTSKAIELRDKKIHNPNLADLDVTKDITKESLVQGVYLMSEPNDYYKSTSVMFIQDKLDYIVTSDHAVKAGSFFTLGTEFCMMVKETFMIGLTAHGLKDTSLCQWTFEKDGKTLSANSVKKYQNIFNGDHTRDDFVWTVCPPGFGQGHDNKTGLGPFDDGIVTPTGPPTTVSYDPFAILQPMGFSMNRASGRSFRIGNNTNLGGNGGGGSGGGGGGGGPNELFLTLDIHKCVELNPPITCEDDDGKGAVEDCELFQHILTIQPQKPVESATTAGPDAPAPDPTNGTDTTASSKPTVPGVMALDDPIFFDQLDWKKNIINLAAEIFSTICEPFPPEMPFTMGRILEFYLAKAHSKNDKLRTKQREVWKVLETELRTCNNFQKQKFIWYWDIRDDSTNDTAMVPCQVKECSTGCTISSSNLTCESDKTLSCTSASPECEDSSCTIDTATNKCVNTANKKTPCSSDSPVCSERDCVMDPDSSTCVNPTCTIKECAPEGLCHFSPVKNQCENSVGIVNMGAIPSAMSTGMTGMTNTAGAIGMAAGMDANGNPIPDGTMTNVYDPQYPHVITKEVIKPQDKRNFDFNTFPMNVLLITSLDSKDVSGGVRTQNPEKMNITGECLFYYEDMAETFHDLNIGIDMFWKIWATTIGYCNSFYQLRKAETFPRLYNTFYEDFLHPVLEEWKKPIQNELLKLILSEYNTEPKQRWLDVCLESSYYASNSMDYRPPRPITTGKPGASAQANYFRRIPDFIKAQFEKVDIMDPDALIECE